MDGLMRVAQRRIRRGNTSRIYSIPAPVGGLNARDPLPNMKAEDAVTLKNFYCTPYDVIMRKGYSINNSGAPDAVNTLASYQAATSSPTLFAWSSDKVYNCTANVGVVGTAVIEGNSSSTFQTINFGTGSGVFQVAVSGVDLPLVYNGTVWTNTFSAAFNTAVTSLTSVGTTATCTMTNPHNMKTGMSITMAGFTPAGYNGTYVITVTGASTFTYTLSGAQAAVTVIGTATPTLNLAITGVDPSRFINVCAFKSRLWFVEKESSKIWYMPTLSIGGAATAVDFTSLFTKGGYLVSMANWSLDAGYGIDDYAAFISSNGQVCIYKGTDPASANTWALVGVYDVGSPIGYRCFSKFGGDVTLICQDGLVLLSQALMSTRVNSKDVLTDKIQQTIGTSITNYASISGWQTLLFPKESMLILNSPYSATQSYQYVMNTISGAWSIFNGWDARCWVLHGDNIYFGGATYVAKAWDTFADDTSNINFEAQQSFNYCGSKTLKKVNMIRPIISVNGTPTLSMGINVDYDMSDPTGIPTFAPTTAGIWDTATWDNAVWAGDLAINRNWQSSFAMGYALSPHLKGAAMGLELHWAATDLMLADGGLL